MDELTTKELHDLAKDELLYVKKMSLDTEGLYIEYEYAADFHIELTPRSKGNFGWIHTNLFGSYTPKEIQEMCKDFRRGDLSNFDLKTARIVPDLSPLCRHYIECNIQVKKED